MSDIVAIDTPVLRQTAEAVDLSQLQSPALQDIIATMQKNLHDERFGVAIAAPQIGVPLRMFIVAGSIAAYVRNEEYDEAAHPDEIYINPEIVRASKKQITGDEGCLSVPRKYGTKVDRAEKVTIHYTDAHGQTQQRNAAGFLARIFQHEIDHLNGILYIDHAREVLDVDDDMRPLEATSDSAMLPS